MYPSNAGLINVLDLGVVPNLSETDTTAIIANTQKLQNAIKNAKGGQYILIPANSTILIYDQLDGLNQQGQMRCDVRFLGENRDTSVLKIANNCPNFQAGSNKAIIRFNSQNPSNSEGSGNQAFGNSAKKIKFNTGSGNPGAIAINYMVNNYGELRECTFEGSGVCAVSMLRYGSGSGLITDCMFSGNFDRHIDYKHWEYSMVVDKCTFKNAGIVCVRVDDGNSLEFSGCTFDLTVDIPCIELLDQSIAYIRDTYFSNDASQVTSAPIKLVGWNSQITTHLISLWGYRSLADIRGTRTPVAATQFSQPADFSSKPAQNLFQISEPYTHIQVIEATPSTPKPVQDWAFVGTPNGGDSTSQIQAALDSGKEDVYFESGSRYYYQGTFVIPSTVRRIHGFGCHLTIIHGSTYFADINNWKPTWEIGPGTEQLEISDIESEIYAFNTHMAGAYFMQNSSSRRIVIKGYSAGIRGLYNNGGSGVLGDLFIENATMGLRLKSKQNVYAKQLNPEDDPLDNRPDSHKIENTGGGKVWILGLKTENAGVVCWTENSQTEIFGGQVYPTHTPPNGQACFVDINSRVYYAINSTGSAQYPITVRSIKTVTETKEIAYQAEHGAGFHLGMFKQ